MVTCSQKYHVIFTLCHFLFVEMTVVAQTNLIVLTKLVWDCYLIAL